MILFPQHAPNNTGLGIKKPSNQNPFEHPEYIREINSYAYHAGGLQLRETGGPLPQPENTEKKKNSNVKKMKNIQNLKE